MVVVVVWPGAVEMVVVVVFFGPTWFTSCASLAVMRRLNSPVRPPFATTVNRLTVVAACVCPVLSSPAETAEMTNRASRPP